MSVLNLSGDEAPECPLCMELLELDDISFYPCTCGYQICRFCWNKLRTEGNGLCPACRQAYTENPADFKPLTSEEIAKIKAEKRQKDQAKKLRISENRKHLANVRVVQKNLVFVVGLSPRLADPEILKKPDYFGKFGKIHKVVINHSTQYAGTQVQGPSSSAYVTYYKSEDALRAIQAVNNIFIDGRTLKASLGTTKYCSHFMKNQPCPKNDCMYLHELGDEAASFTKEEMQQGKHTDYEKQLHEEMLAGLALLAAAGESPPSSQHSVDQDREREVLVPLGGLRSGVGGGGVGSGSSSSSVPPDQSWPDLANSSLPSNYKSSCESSEEETVGSVGVGASGDQVVPSPGLLEEASTIGADCGGGGGGVIPLPADAAPQQQQHHHHHHQPPEPPAPNLYTTHIGDSGWLEQDLKISVSNNFFEEDDLGFDPFHETQKGLADLLESESKAAEAQQHHHHHHHQQIPTPEPDWHSAAQQPPLSRPRAPPPGFHVPPQQQPQQQQQPPYTNYLTEQQALGRLLGGSMDSLFSRQHSQLSTGRPGGGVGRFGGGQPPPPPPVDLLFNHFGKQNSNSLHDHSMLLFAEHKQSGLTDGFGNKDWQDGLRALLPNVNVSFGGNNNPQQQQQQQQQPPYGLSAANGLQNSFHNFGQLERMQTGTSNWGSLNSCALTNDWTALDPAIVTGQLQADRVSDLLGGGGGRHQAVAAADLLLNSLQQRADSPPNWITANLEALTSDPQQLSYGGGQPAAASSLIPAFSSLGLGGGGARGGGLLGGGRSQLGGSSGWGGSSTATPPPGFSQHRAGQLQQPHYPGFGLTKGSEAQKIGDF